LPPADRQRPAPGRRDHRKRDGQGRRVARRLRLEDGMTVLGGADRGGQRDILSPPPRSPKDFWFHVAAIRAPTFVVRNPRGSNAAPRRRAAARHPGRPATAPHPGEEGRRGRSKSAAARTGSTPRGFPTGKVLLGPPSRELRSPWRPDRDKTE